MQAKIVQKQVYKVSDGDTISSVCQKFKVCKNELLKLNKIDKIYTNQVLLLPKPYLYIYTIKPLDTYEKIADTLGVSVEDIKKALSGKKPFIGQQIYL